MRQQSNFLGWKFLSKNKDDNVKSFVEPEKTESSIDVAALDAFSAPTGYYMDLDGTSESENKLVEKYREISYIPEIDQAIDEIAGEAIIHDEIKSPVSINLDDTKLSDNIKAKMHSGFDDVMRMLSFNSRGHDIFRRWYIDGRLFYHVMIDEKSTKKGIQELRFIDPKKIKKIREIKERDVDGQVKNKEIHEYYIYSPEGVDNTNQPGGSTGAADTTGLKVTTDSISHSNSGLFDNKNSIIVSYLHKALRAANNLRMMEDSIIIYRIARAPERRIFYIDVGNLPKGKAEEYLTKIKNKYKNKLVYDVQTGELRDDRRHLAMTEDYWIPRRDNSRGTEITTLPGGQNLDEIADVEYFLNKLYKSLNVPQSRFSEDGSQNMFSGGASEITRDELRFSKFISRLRTRFSMLFDDILCKHLVLKGVLSIEEWEIVRNNIHYDFIEDNHFSEAVENDILQTKLTILRDVNDYVGKYFSMEWVQKNVLRMTEKEVEEEEKRIKEEKKAGLLPSEDGEEEEKGEEKKAGS